MSRLSIATSPPQCLRMAAICGSCSSAKKMCSMDRNSWRRRRASFTASENACSRARLIRMGNSQRDMRAVFYLIPLGLFHAAPQRKLVFARQRVYLPDLGLGHLVWIDAGDADSLAMDVQHDLRGQRFFVIEYALQHVDDEFHRGVVVVVQQNFEQRRLLELLLGAGSSDDLGRSGGAALAHCNASVTCVAAAGKGRPRWGVGSRAIKRP